jgi:hypothetical protein
MGKLNTFKTTTPQQVSSCVSLVISKGVCVDSGGWIQASFSQSVSVKSITVCGWLANSSIWTPTNGSGASIETSDDSNNWKKVGELPNLASKQTIQITATAKFWRFQGISYLGLSILEFA